MTQDPSRRRRTPPRGAACRWAVILLGLLLAACGTARREVETDIVRSISFQGNGGWLAFDQSGYRLSSAMEQGDSPFGVTLFPFNLWVTPEPYVPEGLEEDAYRLEVWYAHHGWFDARFEGWEVQRVKRRTRRRAGVVRIVGHVTPGQPSVFREIEFLGLDRPIFAQFRNTILRTGWMAAGGQFDIESVEATRERLLSLLADHGFPYASVDTRIAAFPEEHVVDVLLEADPGPVSTFGPIEVRGSEAVPEEVIRETLTFEEGAVFDASELGKTQRRLFALQTFAVVNVVPDLSDPARTEVPVRVAVTETQFRTLRFGGGLTYQGTTLTPRLSARFRHVNLLHRLVQLESSASFGYAFSPRLRSVAEGLPLYEATLDLSSGRLLGGDVFGLALSGKIEQDLQAGQYAYFNPRVGVSLRYRPSDSVVATVGPEWEHYAFRGLDEEGTVIARALFGEGFENPYRLTTARASLTVDWRDDPLFTTRGSYHTATLRQAVPLSAKGYAFTGLSFEARTYKRLRFGSRSADLPFTFAGRIQGELLHAWNERGIPYPERAFLGGASDLRGFLIDQVGPYDLFCTHDPAEHGDPFSGEPGAGTEVVHRPLSQGGQVMFGAQGELRYSLTSEIRAVAFLDAGVLEPSFRDLGLQSLRWGAGVGGRYDTVVGPIRLDLAVRPLYPEDAGPVESVGCRPLEVRTRNFDLPSFLFKGDDRVLPFALNVYLAIGEAF